MIFFDLEPTASIYKLGLLSFYPDLVYSIGFMYCWFDRLLKPRNWHRIAQQFSV